MLHFSIDTHHYLVKRSLKPGKKWDICKTSLRKWEGETLVDETSDIVQFCEPTTAPHIVPSNAKEMIYKNESDYQLNLGDILPPEEVFRATQMMMQDAPNIFSLTATERIDILKHIFNLLSIDHAKDILRTKKSELKWAISVLEDTDQYDSKLQDKLQNILKTFDKRKSVHPNSQNDISKNITDLLVDITPIFQERSLVVDSIHIKDFSFSEKLLEQRNDIVQYCTTWKQNLTRYQETTKHHQDLLKGIEKKQHHKQKELHELQQQHKKRKETYQETSKRTDTTTHAKQKEHIQELQAQKKSLHQEAQKTFGQYRDMLVGLQEGDDISLPSTVSSVQELHTLCSELINTGKVLHEKVTGAQQQKKLLEEQQQEIRQQQKQYTYTKGTSLWQEVQYLQQQHTAKLREKIQNHTLEIQQHTNAYQQLQKKLEEAEQNQKAISKKIDNLLDFACPKIWAKCPYIKDINTQGYELLHHQQEKYTQEYLEAKQQLTTQAYTKQIQELEANIQSCQKEIQSREQDPSVYANDLLAQAKQKQQELQTSYDTMTKKHSTLSQQIQQRDTTTQTIKSFVQKVDRKYWKNNVAVLEEIQKDYENTIQHIETYQKHLDSLHKNREELSSLATMIEQQQKEVASLQKEYENQQKVYHETQQQLQQYDYKHFTSYMEEAQTIQKALSWLQELLHQYKEQQQQLQTTIHRHQKITTLHKIFSQELVLLVLEQSIPLIQDIMNSFLSQVVDYTISLDIVQTKSKISLEATIKDHYGQREVDSLSGWQKVILKLTRMLAISAFLESPMLLLDETINNLDQDAIAKVAMMIKDFVHQRQMSFFVITHSTQLQMMDIWDQHIRIADLQS